MNLISNEPLPAILKLAIDAVLNIQVEMEFAVDPTAQVVFEAKITKADKTTQTVAKQAVLFDVAVGGFVLTVNPGEVPAGKGTFSITYVSKAVGGSPEVLTAGDVVSKAWRAL
jgi:hypothetical protein